MDWMSFKEFVFLRLAPPIGAHMNIFPIANSVATTVMESQDFCGRCGYGGCDVRFTACGCTMHTRCTPISIEGTIMNCSRCHRPSTEMLILPMSFHEMDEARKAAAALSASGKREKKRKTATIARLNPEVSAVDENADASDLRTGRWTTEETAFCDSLIAEFEDGQLPIVDGIKLNDFLANMLKSKQSRLTKKMKNAKLSSKTFVRKAGHILIAAEAREFSNLEDSFVRSIPCSMERAEIRFHMQKEWREQFSSFCVAIGQQVNANSWLSSVEEMDRRTSQAKDAARMTRRKLMMGYAPKKDNIHLDKGVFFDQSAMGVATNASENPGVGETDDFLNMFLNETKKGAGGTSSQVRSKPRSTNSPFLAKVISYMHHNRIPFEHVDAWVPSFVPPNTQNGSVNQDPTCRLGFAGYATADNQINPDGRGSIGLADDDHFDLLAFGEYSKKFSFDVGCGLPGRVYQSGVSSWEQNVQNAPGNHFERCGGAVQWEIKTVLGVPVPSPNVGRVVVVFYSRHDRHKDQEMVSRISDDLAKMLPAPKWKLVVDVGTGAGNDATNVSKSTGQDSRIVDVMPLIDEHMPADSKAAAAPYLPGFTSLKLLLGKPNKSENENELLKSLLDSYSSYIAAGRAKNDIALMLARDYMFLSQQQSFQQKRQPQVQPQLDTSTINGSSTTPFNMPHAPTGNNCVPSHAAMQVSLQAPVYQQLAPAPIAPPLMSPHQAFAVASHPSSHLGHFPTHVASTQGGLS